MNIESDTPTPLTDAHAASFAVDSPGWRRFSQQLERKLAAMTVRAEKAEAANAKLTAERDTLRGEMSNAVGFLRDYEMPSDGAMKGQP